MIDSAQLKQITNLAKLSISEDKLNDSADDLNNILKLVEQLSTANTENITPMAHPLNMIQRLRADVVNECDQSKLFQSIAPKTSKKHYLVPTVIE